MADLPPSCPPADAFAVDKTFYRFVKGTHEDGDTPGADDWRLPHEKPGTRYYGRTDVCQCHSHSLLDDLEEAERARKLIPGFRNKRIAQVEITVTMGVVKRTKGISRAHHSWWPNPADLVPGATVLA